MGQRVWQLLCALAAGGSLFLIDTSVQAGGGMTSVPIDAELKASTLTPKVGASLQLTLDFRPTREIRQLRIRLAPLKCAKVETDSAKNLDNLSVSKRYSVPYRLRSTTSAECIVIVEVTVVGTSPAQMRSVYQITLNASTQPNRDGLTQGTTAKGEKTIEAISGK